MCTNISRSRALLVAAACLLGTSFAFAEVFVPLNEMVQRLKTGEQAQLFTDAKTRAGVFTYEDSDHTGLGDPASFLISNSMLSSNRLDSFAVVGFQDSAGKDEGSGLSYFDKVDALTRDQNFLLSLWGQISDNGDTIRIDTFAQLGSGEAGDHFTQRVRLPEAMGGGELLVRVAPDRFKLQSLNVPHSAIETFAVAARDVGALRREPDVGSAIFAEIEPSKAYRITNAQNGWIEFQDPNSERGWTSVSAFCHEDCARLTDNAQYANQLFSALGGDKGEIPSGLSREAFAVWQQARALSDLGGGNPDQALAIAKEWLDHETEAGASLGSLPGGAAFANLGAVARIAIALKGQGGTAFDLIKLDPGLVADIADDLARASVADPKNLEVLQNLAVLFGYLGDEKRRSLALEIAESIRVSERNPL